jgi:transcriptional regulator with XRE-family HTH domain
MSPSQGPLIPRRRLGVELRTLREAAGLQLTDAASHLECSPSKISRLETGQGVPKNRDVRDLMTLYGVTDQKLKARLLRWASDGQIAGWWSNHPDPWLNTIGHFISLESEAATIQNFTGFSVPIWAQTDDYARAIMHRTFPDATEDEIEQHIEIRAQRRQRVLNRLGELDLTVVIDEAVLWRVVTSAAVMRGQLERLLEFGDRPHVDFRVFPFSLGYDQGIQCSSTVFTFDSEIDQDTVFIELTGGDKISELPVDVNRYREIFTRLLGRTPDGTATRDLIRGIILERYP